MISGIKSLQTIRLLNRKRWFWTIKNLIQCFFQRSDGTFPPIDDPKELNGVSAVKISWPTHLPKPRVGLVRDLTPPHFWTKYERFLKNNDLPFKYFDVHKSNWLSSVQEFDIVLWRPESTPASLDEAKRKIYIMERYCKKVCFPSFDTLMLYEDKILQHERLRLHNLPVIDTFISHSSAEIFDNIPKFKFPIVSKIATGAGSMGVELVKNSGAAKRITRSVFSLKGRSTFLPYFRQKDYVYFQRFLRNEGWDLRVIAIGIHVFGYYRDVPRGDFKASGMGLIRKETIPSEALQLAVSTVRKLDLIMAAVDMLKNTEDGRYYIIEVSPFIQVDTAEQLHVDGKAGVYVFGDSGSYVFEEGRFWIQELALREFLERRYLAGVKGLR